MATSSAVVADFMRQLGGSPYFAHVELSKVAQQEQKEQRERQTAMQSFSLNLLFAMPKPAPTAAGPVAGGQAAVPVARK